MKVLVTGSTGYAGSVLTKELLDYGFQVRGMDNGQRNSCDTALNFIEDDCYEFQYGNVNSEKDVQKAFEGVDACIHLGACVGMPITNKFTEYSYLVNVEGTRNIVKFRPNPSIPLLFASTGSIYGSLKEVCTENSPINPLSPYGIQKKLAEDIVMKAGNTCAFRFATAYGPSPNFRTDLLINDLVYKAIKERSLTIFQADFARTFIYIKDFCHSFIYALRNWDKFQGEVFNVGDDKNNWTKRQLAEFIKAKTGCSLFYADEGYQDLDARNYSVSHHKIGSTGFSCKVSMEEGVNEVIKAVKVIGVGNSRYTDKLL